MCLGNKFIEFSELENSLRGIRMEDSNRTLTVASAPSGAGLSGVFSTAGQGRGEPRRRAWQHVQKAQAGLLDAMRALDEMRAEMPPGAYDDCERVLDEAYRTASHAQGHLLVAERGSRRGRFELPDE